MDLSKHLQKAEEASRRRNYPLAIGLYQQLLDLDPDNAEARSGLRKALDRKFDGKKGGGILALVQGFLPLLSAAVAKLTKSHAARARNLERYLALAPQDVGANLALAEALYKAGHANSAYVVYRHLGERIGAEGRVSARAEQACLAWRAAGAVAHGLKKLDEAMECYEAALAINPRDQDALRARKNLSAEGQLDGAGYATAKSSRELLKDGEAQAKHEKAQRLHRSAGEIADDLAAAETRLRAAPDDPGCLREVGELRAQKGDIGGALDCFETALRQAPDDAELTDRIGQLRIREVEAELAKANKLQDDDRAGDLGRKLAGLRLQEARRKVEAHPTDLGLRHALGVLLLDGGDLDGAIAEFQRSVKDPRHKLEALYHLGRSFRRKGMRDLARGQLEKALEAAGPQHGKSLDLLYELGCICEEDGDRELARNYFGRILAVNIGYKDVSTKLETLSGKK